MDCLDQAVWQEVRSLMDNAQRIAHEYARRLQSLAQPSDDFRRLNLDKQLRQCRHGMARLIDAYTGGLLDKDEFEPRIAHLRERRRALENEIQQLNDEALTYTELQLIVGRLEEFAAKIRSRLNDMDFMAKRELIRTLVKTRRN
jgi:site-specific DNA recombinase